MEDSELYISVREEINVEAFELFQTMEFQKMVRKTILKVLPFNRVYTFEDYHQESFIACLSAVEKFNRIHKSNNGNGAGSNKMSLRTYAMWHVFKAIYKLADTGEVVWDVMDENGEYVETISNKEFRRRKKSLELKNYTFNAISLIQELYEENSEL